MVVISGGTVLARYYRLVRSLDRLYNELLYGLQILLLLLCLSFPTQTLPSALAIPGIPKKCTIVTHWAGSVRRPEA